MSGIGAVTPINTDVPVEGHQPPEGDGKKRPPRRPRKPKSERRYGSRWNHTSWMSRRSLSRSAIGMTGNAREPRAGTMGFAALYPSRDASDAMTIAAAA